MFLDKRGKIDHEEHGFPRSGEKGEFGFHSTINEKNKNKIKAENPTKVYFPNKNIETFCHLNKGRREGEAPHPWLALCNGQILSETKSMA